MNILVGYASVHGSTAEVAEFIGRLLRAYESNVTVSALNDVQDCSNYDLFVIGSAIHAGMWLQEMSLFLERCADALKSHPTHMFITCIRVLEADGLQHSLEYYVHQPTLDKLGIDNIGVFAGKLDVDEIDWNERWLLASNYDGTESSKHVNHDYRDWLEIANWAHQIARSMELKPTFEQAKHTE